MSTRDAFLYAMGVSLCAVLVNLFNTPFTFISQVFGMRVRVASTAMVYKKVITVIKYDVYNVHTVHSTPVRLALIYCWLDLHKMLHMNKLSFLKMLIVLTSFAHFHNCTLFYIFHSLCGGSQRSLFNHVYEE